MIFTKRIEELETKVSELMMRVEDLEYKEPASIEKFVDALRYKRIKDLKRNDRKYFEKHLIGCRIIGWIDFMNPEIFYICEDRCVGEAYEMYLADRALKMPIKIDDSCVVKTPKKKLSTGKTAKNKVS